MVGVFTYLRESTGSMITIHENLSDWLGPLEYPETPVGFVLVYYTIGA